MISTEPVLLLRVVSSILLRGLKSFQPFVLPFSLHSDFHGFGVGASFHGAPRLCWLSAAELTTALDTDFSMFLRHDALTQIWLWVLSRFFLLLFLLFHFYRWTHDNKG